ncbi:tRNA pseudouridine(13) synthase TruD [Haloarcula onubensis]|uniref:Probable tRNA pseudouridine synthase D n=1 Tax=Haloarcula onubensis TaxID=2950539 RepID=A0ABU2FJZ1_9EURY|nr:tRNA pseudouridine(13) synthase TruD [Halomicroarcula sp. S3CR25-11]MDS0281043.1 tRNA pseudouridine(13) synthase TruD [Halomicroarcula sp. S3CR25-11]
MREAHPIERVVGMAHYVSDADGVGGHLRVSPEDFRVTELEAFDTAPVDADTGGYPHLVCRVELRDWDTNDFASALSDRLGISRERVSWAGTKDKRAVTRQLFSVKDIDPDDVPDIDGADIEVVGRAGRPILFGDLAGNAFEIVVRDTDAPDNAASVVADLRAFAGGDAAGASATDNLPDDAVTVAVPNYFGQQRFGSRRPVTHEVGLAIVREAWKEAVIAYVGNPHEREPEATQAARAYVDETEDWAGALDRLPRALGYERSMCHKLVENGEARSASGQSSGRSPRDGGLGPEDFREAVETLPTNLQTLFVNGAQSYVFNRILSERLERGLPFDRPVVGDVVCFSDADAPADFPLPDTDRTQRVTEKRLRTVERHCERGRAFVTAPLVGTETALADGEPGEIERAVLEEVGLEPADFALPGEFDSSGTRRAIQVRTDLGVSRDGDDLTFDFALPKGSYATVLLREFRKTDPAA